MKRAIFSVLLGGLLSAGCVAARAQETVRMDHARRFACPSGEIRVKPVETEPHEDRMYFAVGCDHHAIYVCRFARCSFYSEQFFRSHGLSKVRRKTLRELKAERPDLAQLAYDYQHKIVDEEESLAIRKRLRTLDLDSTFIIHEIMRAQSHASEDEKLLFDIAFEIAIARGKSPFDLNDADMAGVEAEFVRVKRAQRQNQHEGPQHRVSRTTGLSPSGLGMPEVRNEPAPNWRGP